MFALLLAFGFEFDLFLFGLLFMLVTIGFHLGLNLIDCGFVMRTMFVGVSRRLIWLCIVLFVRLVLLILVLVGLLVVLFLVVVRFGDLLLTVLFAFV